MTYTPTKWVNGGKPAINAENLNKIEEALAQLSVPDITETTSTTQPNSYAGRENILEIGGVTEQDSTAGNQLFDASNGRNGYYNTSGVFITDATWFACKVNAPSSKVITVSGAKSANGSVTYAEFDESNNYLGYSQTYKNCTVTLKSNTAYVYITCPINEKEGLMVNAGNTALPYEPYTGGIPAPNPSYPMEIKAYKGKNLLDCRGLTTQTVNGITFTPKYDEEGNLEYVEVNGTAIDGVHYTLNSATMLNEGEYVINGCPSGGANTTYRLYIQAIGVSEYGDSVKFTLGKQATLSVTIYIGGGTTANKLRFYPMIRNASIADDTYVPYGLLRVKTHGNQLFDADSARIGVAWNDNTSSARATVVMPCKPMTTYTISCDISRFEMVTWFEKTNVHDATVVGSANITGVNTITTNAKANFVIIQFNKENVTLADIKNANVMLNEGSTAEPYEPYKEKAITLSQPIELYGIGDVQDVITPKNLNRKFGVAVFDGSDDEGWEANGTSTGTYRALLRLSNVKRTKDANSIPLLLCSDYVATTPNSNYNAKEGITSATGSNSLLIYDKNYNTADISLWKSYLKTHPITVVYELATETTEELPIADQMGMNSLATYDGITYVEFDSEIQPTFKAEYGTSKVGGYTLESLLTARNNELRG